MAHPRVLCIRHGESTFNAAHRATGIDPMHFDAPLTETGRAQVAEARERLRSVEIDLVVTSPLTRALQTTAGLFADHPSAPPFLVEVLHRECQESSCDVGRGPAVLAAEFPDFRLDHLPEVWWHVEGVEDLRGFHVEPRDLFHGRVSAFRDWLRARPERSIAVVGHGTFFARLTGRFLANCEIVPLDLDTPLPAAAE